MYICPTCKRHFEDKDQIAKHSLKCWREQNPFHIAKTAPQGSTITTREVAEEALDFFAQFQERKS